jgi:predicted metal-dependent HD superfamily phosphohydrolase
VHRLVMATAGHHPAAADEAMLVDADLAVLGASPNDYAAYVSGVRAEYAHVGAVQWRSGRAQVLQQFLGEPRLFHTAWGARLEQRARANLTAELMSLRG